MKMFTCRNEDPVSVTQFWAVCVLKIKEYQSSFTSKQKLLPNVTTESIRNVIPFIEEFGVMVDFEVTDSWIHYVVWIPRTSKKVDIDPFAVPYFNHWKAVAVMIYWIAGGQTNGELELLPGNTWVDVRNVLLGYLQKLGLGYSIKMTIDNEKCSFVAVPGIPSVTADYV